MRIEHERIALWYGTPDAPAPDNIVSASDKVAITVGIQPVDASNTVEVRYRVNQGKTISNPAQFLKNGRSLTSQYFRASLPAFKPGDTVEYMAICRCAGRQVPSVDELGKFTSSFTVVEAGSQIKSDPPDSQNQQTSSRESINANLKDAQFVHPKETAEKEESILSRLSTRKKKHLKNLTAGIAEGKHKEKLKQLFTETEGEFNQLKARLEESEEFDPESIKQLTFKHEVAELLEDQENWIAACTQDNHINCLRDIALNYKKQDFKSLIRTAGIPEDAEGEDEEDCLEKCATRVCDRLFRMIPTAVVQRMVRDEEIAIDDPKVREGIFSVLNDYPDLDFRKTSVLEVLQDPDCLKQISEEHQEKVADGLKNLQRLSVLSPKAEAVPTLLKRNLTSAYAINEVPMERFVSLYANQLGGEKIARTVHRNAQNITARNEEAYIALRQAITGAPVRMIHGDSATIDRRGKELISVVQQKNIPINFETLFGSVDLCECKHCNSVYSPAAYLVELFQYLRNNNLDPDYENTGKSGYSQTHLEMFFRRRPDLGHLQLTCENTNTLIPYVDLVNEVMESFVFNLSRYENDTFTPKRAIIHTHNVEDESSGELLAEPQHTNYYTYLKLSNTVYPVCKLPYHQPIDATREYLKYLSTSRYELFDTFRADVPLEVGENASDLELERASRKQELEVLAVDRAIAAEFLHFTEEEYIILTKEGFHTKEWYELEEQTSLTLSQYRQKIGFKNTWDYYGIQSEDQMIEELKWVKPAQDTGIVGFLRRVNIQYTDLIELLKTRYINPNYLSGKDLAYMNSLRYSYRYLQSLVDETQTDIKLKYKQLVALLQSKEIEDFKSFTANNEDFENDFIECWIYKNFAKIGKLIILENGDLSCKCIEGTIRLSISYLNQNQEPGVYTTHMVPEISLNLSIMLIVDIDCQIYIKSRNSRQWVGYLETSTGKLVLEPLKLFESNPSFLELGEDILRKILQGDFDEDGEKATSYGVFISESGEQGKVQNFFLLIDEPLVVCEGDQETCDLSKTQLKHLDGTDLTVAEYDRFHRFIRLWCKLGWTIDEVDQAITGIGETIEKPPFKPLNFLASNRFVALMPSKKESTEKPSSQRSNFSASSSFTALPPSEPPNEDGATTIPQPNTTLTARPKPEVNCQPEPISQVLQEITPYLIEQLVAVKKLLDITGLELAKLLTYWTQIGTYGENSLYSRLFLKYNLTAIENVFEEDDYGTYLSQEECISDHLPILMASLKADVNMIETIMGLIATPEALNPDDDSQCYPLTLDNVSKLYRHILLAKTLGIRVKELPGLLMLMQDIAHPFGKPTKTLEFYNLFAHIEDSGFSLRELNYVLQDKDDQLRPLRPSMADIFELAIALRDTLLQIEIDHPDLEKDEDATEGLLRSKLSLLYEGVIVEEIIALLQGTTVYLDNTRRKYSTQLNEEDQKAVTDFIATKRKELENSTEEDQEIVQEFGVFLEKVAISNKVLFPAFSVETFRQAYIQLQKAAIVVEGFNMKREEIDFFRDYCQQFKNLNFNQLAFPQWLRLEAFYRLQKSLTQTQLSLIEFLRWTNETEETETEISLVEQINALTAWEESEVYKMILPQHFNLPDREDFQDERNLLKLQTTLQVAEKIGVGMGDLFQWGKPPTDFTQSRKIARGIRDTIRARYTQEEWEEAIKPTHDLLRNRQRDALIAYLLAQPVLMEWGVRDADSLFEFFLIDVQMDACMETSRIKQAISSVQLFVQRCFLGLEEKYGVSSNDLDRQRWEWMSRYRVWEANRKVFLYPENWIRPELRDIKSPFFEELESELLQNDVSKDTVKSALTKYIVQVDEVANLEVVGQFMEGEGNGRKLHVIGKTRNAPYFFYYRYYDYEFKDWYPWEKVVDIPSIDIENGSGQLVNHGTFVIPVVWNNRLLIFFPEFTPKNWNSTLKSKQTIADGASENKVEETSSLSYWEIKFAWSEYSKPK